MSDNEDQGRITKVSPFYKIHPCYERIRHLRGAILIIEGTIAAGKSTLSQKLYNFIKKVGIPVKFFEEEVDPIMLDLFLSDMQKYAFAFQMHMLVQRQKAYLQAIQFSREKNAICIMDRSLYGDYAFAMMHADKGNISEKEFKAYESVMASTPLPEPSNILYLEVTPETAMQRIQARNRGKEAETYTIDYLHDLDVNYKVCMEESRIKIQYIDWNKQRDLTENQLCDICDLLNPRE